MSRPLRRAVPRRKPPHVTPVHRRNERTLRGIECVCANTSALAARAGLARSRRVYLIKLNDPSGCCTKYSVYPPGLPLRCFGRKTPYVWSAQPGQARRTSSARNRLGRTSLTRASLMSSTKRLMKSASHQGAPASNSFGGVAAGPQLGHAGVGLDPRPSEHGRLVGPANPLSDLRRPVANALGSVLVHEALLWSGVLVISPTRLVIDLLAAVAHIALHGKARRTREPRRVRRVWA
jgi:hypothetical protein